MKYSQRILSTLFLVVLLSPFTGFARPVSQIVDQASPTVTRANFLSWSVEALGYANDDTTCVLPFTRSPRGLKGTLCLAHSKGILEMFTHGTEYTLGQPMTRGEALLVLTILSGRRDTNADVSAFKDVKTEAEKIVVESALTFHWMTPLKSNYFGVDRLLTSSDATTALEAALKDFSTSAPSTVKVRFDTQPTSTSSLPKQDLLDTVWKLLQKDYLHSEKIDRDEAAYKMIEALTSSMGDPYTTFFRPVSADNFSQQLKGEISGIGAQVEEKDGFISVITPLPGSPAERAGIAVGDTILEADSHVLKGLGLEKAVQFIRGTRGTKVHLKIGRGESILEIDVVRDVISIPEIDVKWQGDIAIVQLAQFGQTTEKQIRSIFSDIAAKNPRGIILDLRNNGGGLLTAADEVVSNFVPKNTVVAKVRSKSETRNEVTNQDATVSPDTKVVVLVNKGSASASEIVAGALQDLKRATIVGTQTFGKGTVQEVLSFPDGEAIKITIAEWLTPLGRALQGVGVTPNIVLDIDDRDAQLLRAIDSLR